MSIKLLVGSLTLFCAIAISAVAAYFSVVGLAAMFAATFIPVVLMGTVLEGSKLVAAGWLHSYWKNPKVGWFHKSYLVVAIASLMLITSTGIYGFLVNGHLAQAAANAPIALEIAQKEERLKQLQGDLDRYSAQQQQITDTTNSFLRGNGLQASQQALRARRAMGGDSRAAQTGIAATNAEINKINQELVPLKVKTSAVEAKLGPAKWVAKAFGWKDPETAVMLIIVLLVIAFDPFAIVMMISGTITLGEWAEENRRKLAKREEEPVIAEPEVEPEEPEKTYKGNDIDLYGTVAAEYDTAEISPTDDFLVGYLPEPEAETKPVEITDEMFARWNNITPMVSLNDIKLTPLEDEPTRENLLKELENLTEANRLKFAEQNQRPFDPPQSMGADMTEEDFQKVLDSDAVFTPTQKPGNWGYVAQPSVFEEMQHNSMKEKSKIYKALEDAMDDEKLEKHQDDIKASEEEPEVLPTITDKEILLALLEENPDLLREVIEVIDESRQDTDGYQSWLDNPTVRDKA